MSGGPRIAIDAMGGDTGASAMIAGASRALRKDSSLRFTFYGDARQVGEELRRHKNLANGADVAPLAERLRDVPNRDHGCGASRSGHEGGRFECAKKSMQSCDSVSKPAASTNAAMRRGAHALGDTIWPKPAAIT